MFTVLLAGISHQTAPVEVRERVSLTEDDIRQALEAGPTHPALATFALISTCNRTEIYAATQEPDFDPRLLLDILAVRRPIVKNIPDSHWFFLKNREAVRHLFRVAAGLDSMMVGENQILSQVRDGYRLYSESGASHPLFNKLFHQSFACGKRVRTETKLGEGAVSVASAGVDLAIKIFGSLESKTALLVGTGETGQLAARHLLKKGLRRLLLANRTLSRAVAVADELGGEVVAFDKLHDSIREADMLVLCVEAPQYIITASALGDTLARRGNRPLFVIDLGVPRNAEPACNRLNNVFLYDIDALQKLADMNLERRRSEVPRAEAIVEEMTDDYIRWLKSLRVESTIRSLMLHTENIRRQVLEKNKKHFREDEMKNLDALTRAVVKQIFHGPLEKLKEYDTNMKHGLTRLATIQELFNLTVDDSNHADQDRDASQ
ncbi:MAG: glutamyl-tRNA reductase [Candidatus Sumerlaeia bacterium]